MTEIEKLREQVKQDKIVINSLKKLVEMVELENKKYRDQKNLKQ